MTPTEAREEALKFMRDDLGFDFETEKARGFILGPCTMRDRGEVDDLAKLLLSAYARGRREGIEEAAKVAESEFMCEEGKLRMFCHSRIASAIRFLVKPEEAGK